MFSRPVRCHLLRCLLILCLSLALAQATVHAGQDWPQYRADAARSGFVASSLPPSLSLLWSYQSPHKPAPAWLAKDTRMPLDRAYQPVIAAGMLYYGSSADNKVYALDAVTGAERWTFFTDAPVRFAPALWQGRVFVASDDGRLYCLDGASGKLLWDRRGGPAESLLLGNGTMISRWPARGGPVVLGGIVYFAAGIWPSEGVYIYALDAATGNLLWCNDGSGGLVWDQPHKGARAKSGVAPQGYLVATDKHLLVPNGRGVAAAFSRDAGKLEYFHHQLYGKPGGGSVVATADHFFNGGRVFDLSTGLASGIAPLADLVTAAPETVMFADNGKLKMNRWVEDTSNGKGAKQQKVLKSLSPPEPGGTPAAKLFDPASPEAVYAMISVGKDVVLGGAGRVSVLPASPTARVADAVWSAKVDGAVYGLAFANGCLFASTDQGKIYCFGSRSALQADSAPNSIVAATPYADNSPYAAAAEEILKKTNVKDGYAADLGCGDGALAYELARRTNLRIFAIDADPAKVRQARQKLAAAGLYGTRVTVFQGDPARSNFPNYFANLAVSGRSVAEDPQGLGPERMRVLRPWGGVACAGRPGAMDTGVRRALEGAGEWTHQYGDAANTDSSGDRLVKAPLGMLWFRDYEGIAMASRHGRPPAPLFSEGRLFFLGFDSLHALDAYNGRLLWDFAIPEVLKAYYNAEHLLGTSISGGSFCLDRGSIYVRDRDRCLRVEAATGRKLGEFAPPAAADGKIPQWGYLAAADGLVFGSTAIPEHVIQWSAGAFGLDELYSESSSLFALDPATGKPRWVYQAQHAIRHNAIAIGGGRVYLIDCPLNLNDRVGVEPQTAAKKSKAKAAPAQKGKATSGNKAKSAPQKVLPTGELIALNAATGEVLWRSRENIYGTMLALSVDRNLLLMTYQPGPAHLPSERGGRMAVLRALDGKRVWDIAAQYNNRPLIVGDTIYAQPGAWDLLTGAKKDFTLARSHGCGTFAGSPNLLTFRSATLGFRDLTRPDSDTENYGGIRPGCWINAIPAGGLVLQPDATEKCTCNYLNKAFIALQPMGE